MKITMDHVRQARMCSRGARDFFRRYNLDWEEFLREGIDEEKLIELGDAMALQVVEVAHGRVQ